MNTDFSSEVDPESMIAEAVDPASGPMFEAFGPRLDVPAHASESSR